MQVAVEKVVVKVKNKNNYKHSFLLALILNRFDATIPKDVSPFVDFISGILVLSLIVFFSVFNVFMYIISNWLIEKKISSTRIKNIIDKYRKLTIYYVLLEFILIFVFLLVIIISCIAYLGINIYNLL